MIIKRKKFALITAMKEEAEHIISTYNLEKIKELKHMQIYENDDTVLFLAGIWKIQASIATTYLCLHYSFDTLINIGIAWSLLWDKAVIGDIFIINKIIQHDMHLPFDGEHLNYAKKPIYINNPLYIEHNDDIKFWITHDACCLTWDQFISDEDILNNLRKLHVADVVEMEAFAIASVAYKFDLLDHCIFIKAISDGANSDAKEAHMDNLDFAMNNSIIVLRKIIW